MRKKYFPTILSDLKKGQKAIIIGFSNEDIPIIFFEMGIFPGIELEMLFVSIFCDPLCISCGKRRYCLVIRKSEAQKVLIKPILNEDNKTCSYRKS